MIMMDYLNGPAVWCLRLGKRERMKKWQNNNTWILINVLSLQSTGHSFSASSCQQCVPSIDQPPCQQQMFGNTLMCTIFRIVSSCANPQSCWLVLQAENLCLPPNPILYWADFLALSALQSGIPTTALHKRPTRVATQLHSMDMGLEKCR